MRKNLEIVLKEIQEENIQGKLGEGIKKSQGIVRWCQKNEGLCKRKMGEGLGVKLWKNE